MIASSREISVVESISFQGHPNILGTHYNTIEVTTVGEISRRADCVIGVNASKACSNLDPLLKRHIQSGGKLAFEIFVGDTKFFFVGKGRIGLELSDTSELVLRRSDFVSNRTAAISCSAAAIDIPREVISLLQKPSTTGELRITALNVPDDPEIPLCIET